MTDEDDEDAVIIPPKLRSNSSPLPTVQDLPSSPDPAAAKVAIPSSRPDPSSHLAHENDLENDQQRPTKNTRSKSAKNQISKTRFTWISLVRICTCCLPNKLLLYLFKGNKQVATAFREKLVLNFAILLVSFAFFFLVIGLQWLVCPQANQVLSEYELQSLSSDSYPLVSIYGNYYLIKDVYTDHVKNAAYLSAGAFAATVLGQDVRFVSIYSRNQLHLISSFIVPCSSKLPPLPPFVPDYLHHQMDGIISKESSRKRP